MEKKFNFVYITRNLINGKKYIGNHSTDNVDDYYIGSGIYLKKAIKKEGKENFKREILEYFDTGQEAFNAQKKWIDKFNTVNDGYNISPYGGLGISGSIHNEESKKKISFSLKGKKRKPLTDSHIRKLRKNAQKRKGVSPSKETKEKLSNSQIGRIFSDDHRKKLSESAKKRKRTPMTEEIKERIKLSCIATKKRRLLPP